MKRKMKLRMVVSIIVMLAVIGLPVFTLADDQTDRPPAPTIGYPAGSSMLGNDFSIGVMSLDYLFFWNATIMQNSGNSIRVRGTTDTASSVDKIAVQLTLQYWDSSSEEWKDLSYAGEWYNLFASSVLGFKDYTVSSGYYYRTKALHYASHEGNMESKMNYSGYIYIP